MSAPPDSLRDVATVIRARRTIHQFKPDPAPRAALRRAFELACWAPNHRLTEPWRFHVIGPETAAAIAVRNAELVTAARGAQAGQNKLTRWRSMPGWFAVTCRRSADPIRAREDEMACACAIQNAMLYLWSEGIGVKWGTGPVTRDARFFELLGLDPDAERVVGLFWYGYPAEVPPDPPRRSLDDVMTEWS